MNDKFADIVFISFAFEDLKPHRRAVWSVLEQFEVNVRGMEEFGARPDAPLDTCLAEVEQSDIYVGIICKAFNLPYRSTIGLGIAVKAPNGKYIEDFT